VSRRFEQEGLRRHDGIDIPAAKDTPIRAAADGVVLFSDWGPGGYGRIVIIRHDQDMVTLYAHNERNLVQVGQTVRQGEQIATVGKTGRATAYHVHFEIRHKTTPVSPLQYLRSPRQLVQLGAR
jgi:murein DD-endopeptidase MepM/ murein hydrolase activator NlpD